MKAISIRQPWAWLILHPDLQGEERAHAIECRMLKDIENRTGPTRYRGEILIHAAKGMTRAEYAGVEDWLAFNKGVLRVDAGAGPAWFQDGGRSAAKSIF